MKFCRHSIWILACLLILLSGSLVQTFFGYCKPGSARHAWGNDDAYISYRYAKNFVNGHGLVFNPGERVEGYSNFFYVLLISLGLLMIPPKSIYFWSVLVNTLFVSCALFIFYRYVKGRLGETKAIIAAFMFALSPPIWVAVASGLETPLVLLLQISIWVCLRGILLDQGKKSKIGMDETTEKRDQNPSHLPATETVKPKRSLLVLCLIIAVSVLARADGFILPIIVIFYFLLRGKKQETLYCVAAAVLTIIPYSLWRHSYYGYFLPNTYYVKVAGPIVERLRNAFLQLVLVAVFEGFIAYFLVLIFAVGKEIRSLYQNGVLAIRQVRFEIVFAVAWLTYWIYVGGDYFLERFLLILIPLGIYELLGFLGTGSTKRAKPLLLPTDKALPILVALLLLIELSPLVVDSKFDYRFTKYDCYITLGTFLGKRYPGKVLAIDAAGKAPYFSGLKTIDMLGLNDEFIGHRPARSFVVPGHNKYDPDYVISRNPDLIAAWIAPDMNLAWGLTKEKYRKAGYRLKYLLNLATTSYRNNIIDVSHLDVPEIRRLRNLGYEYAVLEKED